MPSVRYYNQTAPFWDFVASLEDQGAQHPLFGGRGENSSDNEDPRQAWGWPFGPVPHRGRHGHHHPHHPHQHPHGPPSPPGPPPPPGQDTDDADPPTSIPQPAPEHDEAGPSEPRGPSHCGGRRGGPWARRGWHGRGARGFPFAPAQGAPAPFWAELIRNFTGENVEGGNRSDDFKPEADVFDTTEGFVVHVSLPGAKKEDVGVSWDAEKSELNVAGVIYRPGDEDFLKTLALSERNIGAFERKIRLGSRANPAQIDADGITARMEDGVLTVEVPKLDSGYVEIKKVDIE